MPTSANEKEEADGEAKEEADQRVERGKGDEGGKMEKGRRKTVNAK